MKLKTVVKLEERDFKAILKAVPTDMHCTSEPDFSELFNVVAMLVGEAFEKGKVYASGESSIAEAQRGIMSSRGNGQVYGGGFGGGLL